jgi:hypothetical protein
MRPVSSEVWPASRSMKASVRSGFDKGWKDTSIIRIGKSLLWGVVFEIIMHVWNFHSANVFLDSNFVVKESNKCHHLNLVSKHTIRNTMFMRQHIIQLKRERHMTFIRIGKSLLWDIVFEIIMHVCNFRTGYVFLDSNIVVKENNKCYNLNLIFKHTVRNTTFMRRHNIQ